MKRAGYHGFLRNVLVAAGCSKDRALLPPVLTLLRHAEPLVRGHAAWAAGRLGGLDDLERLLGEESDPWVRDEATAALQDARDGG